MSHLGRLPEPFRNRTKAFAAGAIRLFAKLSRQAEQNRVLGRQLLRSGTSVAAQVREVGSSRVDLQACKLEYSIVSPK